MFVYFSYFVSFQLFFADHNVDFGSASTVQALGIKLGYRKGTDTGGYLEAHVDGELVGTVYPPSTGDWSNFGTTILNLDVPLEGTHTLKLEAFGQVGLMNLDWFQMTTERPETVLTVGTDAASCWERWGTTEVLLTPSSHRGNVNGEWSNGAKVLMVNSFDVTAGTVTVARSVHGLGDPSTWDNGPSELAAEVALTSRTNANKTYTYDRRIAFTNEGSVRSNERFEFLVSSDEYDVRFIDPVTGNDIYHSIRFWESGPTPVCEGLVTGGSSFNIAQPPPGVFPLYSRFNASQVVAQSGVVIGNTIGYVDLDDWWGYRNVYFGAVSDTTRIRIRYNKATDGGTLQVRLGTHSGQVIATFAPWKTGEDWGNWVETYFDIDVPVEGLHQVTFVAKDINHGLFGLDWWELAPPPPPTEGPTLEPTASPVVSPTASPLDPNSVWKRFNAGDVIAQSGVVISSGGNIGYFDKNDWFTYDNVYFGTGGQVGQIKLRFSKGNWPAALQVRLGGQHGRVIGTFRPWHTGSWGTFIEASFPIDETIEGYHQVTFKGIESAGVFGLDWWELAPPVNPVEHTLYERKEAGDVLAFNGVVITNSGSNLGYFDRNDFVIYDNIWFGNAGDVT